MSPPLSIESFDVHSDWLFWTANPYQLNIPSRVEEIQLMRVHVPTRSPPCRGVKRGSNSVYWRETTNFRGYWDHETNTFNPGEFNRVVFLQTKPEFVKRWGEFVFLKIICLFCKIISTEKEIKCQQTRLKW